MAKSTGIRKVGNPKAIGGAPKVNLPSVKNSNPKTPQLSDTGLGGYLKSSKLLTNPKQPKNNNAQFNAS